MELDQIAQQRQQLNNNQRKNYASDAHDRSGSPEKCHVIR
jgi:HPt (histidine-containing phosphotransfer) domain-containing protein